MKFQCSDTAPVAAIRPCIYDAVSTCVNNVMHASNSNGCQGRIKKVDVFHLICSKVVLTRESARIR